jgi:choloylglycine hydrolase
MKPILLAALLALPAQPLTPNLPLLPCTGISLVALDQSRIVARTVEWALSDAAHDRLAVVPRGKSYRGLTPVGDNGLAWVGEHGYVTITAYGTDYGPDAMNEHGLYVGMYYFPGYADYAPYDPEQAARSLSVGDFQRYLLSTCSSVAQAREALDEVIVVNVDDPRFGGAALPFHWKIADPTGACIVVEIVEGGQVRVFDAFLGVITNSPGYDWHLTNLRNYTGLRAAPDAPVTIDGRTGGPFGAGSGLIGLPGDFTPPSRFVRAVALTASARPLEAASDAVFEAFRILDSFNIPVGATQTPDKIARDIPSATQITVASDLTNRAIWFHTMHDREVRKVDLARIDFGTVPEQVLESGASREQHVREVEVRAE